MVVRLARTRPATSSAVRALFVVTSSVTMRTTFIVAALVGCLAFAAAAPYHDVEGVGRYLPTPVGYIREECVREVPNGVEIEELEDHILLHHPDKSTTRMEFCDTEGGKRPVFLEQVGGPLPADYDVRCRVAAYCIAGHFSLFHLPGLGGVHCCED